MRTLPNGWSRTSDPRAGTLSQSFEHVSGWRLVHCGHPTANWPWYLSDPARPGTPVVSWGGRAFRTMRAAFAAFSLIEGGAFVEFDRFRSKGRAWAERLCVQGALPG